MKTTENLGLNLFEGTDKLSLAQINANAERLDQEIPSRIGAASREVTAFYGAEEGKYKVLLKEVHPFTMGPYVSDPASQTGVAYIDDPSYTDYEGTFWEFDYAAQSFSARIAGEYTYACYGKRAYRLNNRTKGMELLLDLSSRSSNSLDQVVCVDEDYVYYVRHVNTGLSGNYNGYLEKFSHDGALVGSVLSSSDGEWSWNVYTGFSNAASYASMWRNSYQYVTQTKNYIVVCCVTTGRDSSGHYRLKVYVYSKQTLARVGNWSSQYESGSTPPTQVKACYSGDYILFTYWNSLRYFMYKTDLSTPGTMYTAGFYLDGGTGKNDYNFSMAGGVGDYAIVGQRNTEDGGFNVCNLVRLSDISSEATFDISSGVTPKYTDTSDLYVAYDPINDEFNYYGEVYDPLTESAPSTEAPTLCTGFYRPSFSYVDGEYYMVRTADGAAFRIDSPCYVVDRLVKA